MRVLLPRVRVYAVDAEPDRRARAGCPGARCRRRSRVNDVQKNVELREEVRARYAASARAVTIGTGVACDCSHPGTTCEEEGHVFGAELYAETDRETLPADALLASLGCGNPTAVADLHEGDTVLDLGSGGGIDVLLSARRVGPTGKVYGLDMTEEMLALALENKKEAGATNVEFLKGYIEDIPLPASTIDVVISNCVVNLSTDKPKVFAEIARVLKPGGRIGISDVVAEDRLTPKERAERGSYVGCIAGALSFDEYEEGLRHAGFTDVSITSTGTALDGIHNAIVKATKDPDAQPLVGRTELPVAQGCC
jgi:arsenite methyltransferase